MKNSTNNWLIAGAASIMIGILGFFFIMSIARWDFYAIGKAKYRTETVEIKGYFRDISINTDTENIVFKASDDGKCRVEFYEHEKVEHNVSAEGGTLSIGVTDTRNWYEHLSLFFDNSKITVYLPGTGYGLLFIQDRTGDIMIPEGFTFENISISASTGDVDCGASAEGLLRISTGTGDIHTVNSSAAEYDLSVSTGKIDLNSVSCDGNLGLSVSTGKTVLEDVSCGSIVSDGSTGDITLKNVAAAKTISVTRSTGDVRFERCDADELTVTTGTGDVTGTLLSEKIFIVQSHTGRIDVPESTSGGKCRITTDTGKIVIGIE